MPIDKIEFVKLERELMETSKSPLDYLAPSIGKAYVVAITRDGCPACEKQEPKLERLATTLAKKYGDKAIFTRIHVKYTPGSEEESLRSKDTLSHYFYPTNLILLRTPDRGAIELYRNASPKIDEFKRNIEIAVEIATMIEKEMN